MKETSLNILDIVENSVKAKATLTEIKLTETEEELTVSIIDNGVGMSPEVVKGVTNPFYTTRTTRSVGLGIPLIKLSAEQTGGSFKIESTTINDNPLSHGTTLIARYNKTHIDYTPLGDIVTTLKTLIHGHPDTDFLFSHTFKEKSVTLDTRELREELEGIPLNTIEVINWVEEYLSEQYQDLYN